MRLIDADALMEHLRTCSENGRPMSRMHDIGDIIAYVERMPTVDAVPVDFINQKIVELQSCANQHFNDGHEILATCVWETIRLLGSILKEWRGKEKEND